MKENIYKIFLPNLKASDFSFEKVEMPEVRVAIDKANENYLSWEDLKYKNWLPLGIFKNTEDFWFHLHVKRYLDAKPTPIRDKTGIYFRMNTNFYNEFLHIIDKEMAGNFMGVANLSENNKRQFVVRNVIEESIASSQLEGANTSRAVAKKMLLEGRRPQNHSEIMIVNNHKAMLKIEEGLYKEELSWELLCELHSMITDQTIPKEKQGKLRETYDEHGEKLKIIPWASGEVTYITPDKEFVESELPKLIDFANDKKTDNNDFIHPLIKAIMLHFWIGLLHPFEDGNGRLARVLFYWYMLKHEYWAFKYLSLSEKIKKSSKQYAMAYINSEQDSFDLNYFIYYNVEQLKLAKNDFQKYVQKKTNENRVAIRLNQQKFNFNDRQIKLLHYFNQDIENNTNLNAYQQLYAVKKGTAVADLKELVTKGFVSKKKQGRNTYYYPMEKVSKFFES